MEPKNLDSLPAVVADTESLQQQQLRELHASVKAQSVQRQNQADQTADAGMVIRGK